MGTHGPLSLLAKRLGRRGTIRVAPLNRRGSRLTLAPCSLLARNQSRA